MSPSQEATPAPRRVALWQVAAALVVVGYLVCALVYWAVTPYGSGQDELSHIGYVVQIAYHFQLPGPGVYERQQPPLYYLIVAIIEKLGHNYRIDRLFSPLLGAGTVIVTMACARVTFPERPWRAVLAGAMVAAIPQFQWVDATVTDDPLAFFMGAVVILVSLSLLVSPNWEKPSFTRGLTLGIVTGLTLLSKETDYVLLVLLYLCIAYRWRFHSRWSVWGVIVVLPAAISGWWYARNIVVFRSLIPHLASLAPGAHIVLLPNNPSEWQTWARLTFQSFFGFFGPGPTALQIAGHSTIVTRVLELVCGLIIVSGLLLWASRWPHWDRRSRSVAVLCALAVAACIIASILNSIQIDFQPQGRYLAVALPAIVLPAVWAICESVARWRRSLQYVGLFAIVVATIVLDIGGLTTMAGPGRAGAGAPPAASAAAVMVSTTLATSTGKTQ